ncbi:hypothetical protein BD626DRAFT_216312 [Schizophyllum amplum]|uniref:Uncharacterized protein n=1 Tax=Schizophyllum amplum TaxID=97359 RepID=A0A550CKJ2_9AGAR|nr:hypothetical protein BD626DRAFT_216312 [Auriculariopsis ampla]
MSNHSDETLVNSPPATSPGSASDTVFAASPKPIGEHDLQVHQGPRANQSPRSGPLALFEHTRQLDFFNEANALNMRDGGPIVPQRMYMPTTRADRRYVEAVGLQPPIYFLRTDGDYGIPLSTALRRRTSELADPSQRVFDGVQPSVSIRLEWPGYRSWTRQIPTKDFRKVQMPITREKLAKEIAKCVQRFIKERQQHPITGDAQLRAWRIGDRASSSKTSFWCPCTMSRAARGSPSSACAPRARSESASPLSDEAVRPRFGSRTHGVKFNPLIPPLPIRRVS